ncbi:methyltransferase domain-containing protein [Caminibacter mediatlanticus]|uniref:Methyl transferase n=1 Tax=Caminibacter mediatlanticus TB-2 TaxID=391592 RepID=A0AAI9AHN6_9BACT|nr:methyltransferase domain-containing protein [Caminibacter mediatlanticus]EDM23684.1 putative methyl transferase [Caminibacter mediatlanticus TB-2]
MRKFSNFDKFANHYQKYNLIQKKIINKYLPFVKSRIIDLGCGSIGLCKYKKFDFYLGIDISEKMLSLNPCNTLKADFNTKECYELIKQYNFDQVVSFSALQWAKDLEFVFKEIKSLNKEYLLAIFTSNTFKTLHNYLDYSSPIYSKKQIINYSKILNPTKIEILNYKLEFDSAKKMVEYIKYSGVGGGEVCNISKLKRFIKEFPFNYLEFEIVVLRNDF